MNLRVVLKGLKILELSLRKNITRVVNVRFQPSVLPGSLPSLYPLPQWNGHSTSTTVSRQTVRVQVTPRRSSTIVIISSWRGRSDGTGDILLLGSVSRKLSDRISSVLSILCGSVRLPSDSTPVSTDRNDTTNKRRTLLFVEEKYKRDVFCHRRDLNEMFFTQMKLGSKLPVQVLCP